MFIIPASPPRPQSHTLFHNSAAQTDYTVMQDVREQTENVFSVTMATYMGFLH